MGVLDLFRRPRRAPHPCVRELLGLQACIIAWRRGGLEHRHREGSSERAALDEKLELLRWYAQGAGCVEPFAAHALEIPLGGMTESDFLEASFRIETAGAIAWALGLAAALPPGDERADVLSIARLFPSDAEPPPEIDSAALRDRAALAAELNQRKLAAAAARRERDACDEHATAIVFSRAYERARGLAWVCGTARWLHETPIDF